MKDLDDSAYWVLRKTLFLWLFPYLIWYLGRALVVRVYEWVTEPIREAGVPRE